MKPVVAALSLVLALAGSAAAEPVAGTVGVSIRFVRVDLVPSVEGPAPVTVLDGYGAPIQAEALPSALPEDPDRLPGLLRPGLDATIVAGPAPTLAFR